MAKHRFRDIKQGKISPKEKTDDAKKIFFARKSDIFKAILTDSFMLWMPIVYFVMYVIVGSREEFAKNLLTGWLYILIPLTLVEIAFLAKSSQTPGMKAYNLKLIYLPTGQKPPFIIIAIRQILSKITFFTFAWIIIFFRKDGRNLHDLFTSTALVYDDTDKNFHK